MAIQSVCYDSPSVDSMVLVLHQSLKNPLLVDVVIPSDPLNRKSFMQEAIN